MTLFKKLLPLFLLSVIVLTGCQKETIVETEVIPDEVTPTEEVVNGLMTRSSAESDGLELICLTVEYPFSVILLDSTTAEVFSDEDFEVLFTDEDNFPIDFLYPLTVVDEDGNASVANDAEELAELFADCIPDIGWGDEFPEWFFPAWVISFEYSCYELLYPVVLLDLDSTEVVADSEDDLVEILADGNLYSFSFPISLENEEGEVVTADDPEDLFDLLSECAPDYDGGCGIGTFGCYDISYPATLELIDGTTVEVEDDDGFAEVIMSGDFSGFVFPLTLIDEEGNEVTANSQEELDALLLECFGGFGGGGGGIGFFGCYTAEFPISVILSDSSIAQVESEIELAELLFNAEFIGFQYPFILIDQGGQAVEVNSDEELQELIDECYPGGGGTGGEFDGDFICYDIDFPVEVLDFFGGTIVVNNSEEWEALLYDPNGGLGGFVYPVTLIDIDSGEETVVSDDFELIEAIEECW